MHHNRFLETATCVTALAVFAGLLSFTDNATCSLLATGCFQTTSEDKKLVESGIFLMQRATAPRERVLAACAALLLVLVLLLSARLAQLRPPACADAVSSAGGLVLSLPRGPRPWTTAVTRPRSEDGAAFAAAARSQDGEDVYAATRFGLNAIRGGFFVELGALNGLEKSNSFAFEAALGWTGLLIEPGPRNFASLLRNRPRSVLVNAAVCGTFREVHFLEPEEVSRRPVSGIVRGFCFFAHKFFVALLTSLFLRFSG